MQDHQNASETAGEFFPAYDAWNTAPVAVSEAQQAATDIHTETTPPPAPTHANHMIGIGHVAIDEETQALGWAGRLVYVYSNARRGFSRIYFRDGRTTTGPEIIKAEEVELTA